MLLSCAATTNWRSKFLSEKCLNKDTKVKISHYRPGKALRTPCG
jgi:hypothetical protein